MNADVRVMRVAMVGPYPRPGEPPRGGVQTATYNLCQALRERPEVDVTVLATSPDVSMRQTAAEDGVKVVRIPQGPGLSGWWKCMHVHVPGVVRELDPDVVHVQGIPSVALRTKDSVLTIHGNLAKDTWYNSNGGVRRIARVAGALVFEIAPAMIAPRRIVVAPGSRGAYIPNAIDPIFFNRKLAHSRLEGRFVACGEISPLKNTLGILRAFEVLLRTRPNATLVVVGDGDGNYVGQCRAFVAERGLSPHVRFAGPLRADAVAVEYRRSQSFVHFSNRENAPMVLVEAMASGCAVVATDVGATRELLAGDPWAELVRPLDVGGLALAMDRSLATAVDMSQRRNLDRYRRESVATETIAVYRRILTRR